MIDAHQHFWATSRDDYGWLVPDDEVLYRDFGPADLAPLIAESGITRTVLVQAAATVAETKYLLDIAKATEWIAGVVGWVSLADPGVGATLDQLTARPGLLGVRPMIQDLPDDEWMLQPAVGHGLEALAARDLTFDALVLPRHLGRLLTLCKRHPALRVVVDHAAKPEIRSGGFEGWARDLARIATGTSAFCKISGLATEASKGWRTDDLRPYVDWLIDRFGPDRLMWGSDWPVVQLAGGFARWRDATCELLQELTDDERAAILGKTAARFYRLDAETPSRGALA